MTKIVIVGCGVIGLYTGYLLIERGIDAKDISIITKHIPGDLSHDYASPYAGAISTVLKDDSEKTSNIWKFSYLNLEKLEQVLGDECGLGFGPAREFWYEAPSNKAIGFVSTLAKNFKVLPKEEIPSGSTFGLNYDTWHFNSPKFIKTIFEYLKKKGVKVYVKEIAHIEEVCGIETKHVFNCTGLGSQKLGGVNDSQVMPIRAQVLVIKAPQIKESLLCWGKDSSTYILRRPQSHDEVILGGFYQPHNYNKDIVGTESEDILKRVAKLQPKILETVDRAEDLHVLRAVSAFRPGRKGGVRIEKEYLPNGVNLIHNYGAAGSGFALGLGMSKDSIDLAFSNDAKL